MDEQTDILVPKQCETGEQTHVDGEQLRLTFRKGERLHHHALVEQLFAAGESMYAYPLRMFWTIKERREMLELFHGAIPGQLDCLQMMVTVPKKKFKHAVDRVWLRRRIREAYRLNRQPLKQLLLNDGEGRFMQLAFIYVGDSKREYASIEKKMKKLLDKAAGLLDTTSEVTVNAGEAETSKSPSDE